MPRNGKKSKRGKTTVRRFSRKCFIVEKHNTVWYAESVAVGRILFRTFCQLRYAYILIDHTNPKYPHIHINEEACKKCRLGEAIRQGKDIWPLNIKFQSWRKDYDRFNED